MRKRTLNNQGVALVTVVLFFLVLVILLGGVMFSSISNQGNAKLSKDHTSAYYVAESGLNITIEKLKKFLIDNNYSSFPPNEFATKKAALESYLLTSANWPSGTLVGINPGGEYTIQITSPIENQYLVSVTGEVNDVSRTIQGTFSYETILEPMAKAVIAKGSITMGNNATIDGPIASLMQYGPYLKNNGKIELGNAVLDVHNNGGICQIDEVYVPNTNSSSVSVDGCTVKKTISTEVKFNSFTIPSYPLKADLKQVAFSNNKITFPNLDGKLGYYIDSLPTTPFEIDTGTGNGTTDPIKLYVLDVSTSSNGTTNIGNITVTGSDQVMVHITIDSTDTSGSPSYYFSWASNVNVGQTDMTKFQLVIRKGVGFSSGIDPVFTIPNGNTFVGSVLMDYVNIELKNMTFVGFIGTLGTTITTGSNGTISGPMWVYAPNAVVDMSSGITINGSIMASSVSLNSGATIIYDSFEGQVPFELNLPIFMGGEMAPVGIKFKFINFKEV